MEKIEGVWYVEGTTVYTLRHNGHYQKGEPLLENRFTVSVQHRSGLATKEEAESLAKSIAERLNSVSLLSLEEKRLARYCPECGGKNTIGDDEYAAIRCCQDCGKNYNVNRAVEVERIRERSERLK